MVGLYSLLFIVLLSTLTTQWSTLLARDSLVEGNLATTRRNLDTLAQSKQALLDFVVAPEGGHLPCPNQNGDGVAANTDCPQGGNPAAPLSMLGLLPWSSLGLPPLRDREGQCLWYAVSGWHHSTATGASHADLSETSAAGFEVVNPGGDTRDNQVVAVVLAPIAPTQAVVAPLSDAPCALAQRAASSASRHLQAVTLVTGETVDVAQLGTTPRLSQRFVQTPSYRMAWITRAEFNRALAHHKRWSDAP